MKKESMKNIKGITLIALVVTIIILIILAGISINLVLGENGIIQKSKQAAQEYKEAQMREELELLIASIQTEITGNFTQEQFEQLLNSNGYEMEEDTGIIVSNKYPNMAILIDLNSYELGDIIYLDNVSTQITFTANNYINGQESDELVGNVKITIKANEIKNGLESIQLFKDGEILINETNKRSYKNEITVAENGTYTLKTKANVTGEETINEIVITKIDTNIPTVEITQNPTTDTYGKKVTLTIKGIGTQFNAIDTIKDENGNELQLTTSNYEKTALYEVSADGTYSFIVTYKDSVGSIKTLPTVTYTVNNTDNEAPSVTLSKNTEEEVETVNITIFAEDERAGVKKIYVVNDESETELELTTVTGGKQAIYPVQVNGTYNFKAEDELGNISENKSIIISNIVDESNRTYLYNLGDTCSSRTGGWKEYKQEKCVVNYNSDNIEMYHTGASFYNSYVNTVNKINVSNYTKLKMKYEITGTYTGNLDYCMKFGLTSTVGNDKFTYSTDLNYTKLGTYIAELDISDVTGSYYCEVWRCQNNTGIKIYKVWFE